VLTVSGVSKSFGGRDLFSQASLQVNPGDRIGLIGPNGAGKSTLFSLLLGAEEPDAGSVSLQRGVRLAYLPQESAPAGEETILELACGAGESMEDVDPRAAAQAKRCLSGLGFQESDFERPAREMSGGWVMRAHIARLLVMDPDLLMLDEPTNHLDIESLAWFQSTLRNFRGAILTISHDREFLNTICRSIVEICRGRLDRYSGTYEDYVVEKAARHEQYVAAYQNQQREIQHLEQFISRFRAKASKAAQAQERIKRLERMERMEPPETPEATVTMRFPRPPRGPQRVAKLREVTKAYGTHIVYEPVDLDLERGQRAVLVGPNGAGKSTLLKLLAGIVRPDTGSCELGEGVTAGYFAQHRAEALDPERTVLEEALEGVLGVGETAVRTALGCFLFRGDDVFKRVAVLSGGEKTRLALIKLLLDPPNLLLLDEPTTHLDMPSIEALTQALAVYEGTLLVVSHDVHFIRSLGGLVLHVHDRKVTRYAGNYDYYLEKSAASDARSGLTAGVGPGPVTLEPAKPRQRQGLKEIKEEKRRQQERARQAAKARREAEAEYHRVEAEITRLEQRQQEITHTLQGQQQPDIQLHRELVDLSEKLHNFNQQWEELAEALASEDPV